MAVVDEDEGEAMMANDASLYVGRNCDSIQRNVE